MRFIMLIALFVSAIATGAEAETYAAELDKLAAKSDLNDLIKRVNQPRSAEEFHAGLDWLRAKSISGFGGTRIHYMYAAGLFRANVKETAAFVYLIGLLTSRIDGSRCADSSAPGEKLFRWELSLAPILQHFLSLQMEERKKLVSLAIVAVERIPAQAPDTWLCSGGLSFYGKFMEKHKNNPNPPAREIEGETSIGRTIILDDPTIKPAFVSDEEWRTRRKQIISSFAEQILVAK